MAFVTCDETRGGREVAWNRRQPEPPFFPLPISNGCLHQNYSKTG